MSIKARLMKLEAHRSLAVAGPLASKKLQEDLSTIYDRICDDEMDEGWASHQSNSTIIAAAIFGKWPLTGAVVKRLSAIVKNGGTPGIFANSILEAV